MLLTEQEAKAKRCCGPEGTGRVERGRDEHPIRCCIASHCMAWRWHVIEEEISRDEWRRTIVEKRGKPEGFCGLAGVPQ
jgi:hypothetical protein